MSKRKFDEIERGVHAGFDYLILHDGMGHRNGYVRIPEWHPWFGKHYDDIDAEVHGGLTYSAGDSDLRGPGFWIGFDTAHAGDASDPSLGAEYNLPSFGRDDVIRTTEYVRNECFSLIKQAQEVAIAGKA